MTLTFSERQNQQVIQYPQHFKIYVLKKLVALKAVMPLKSYVFKKKTNLQYFCNHNVLLKLNTIIVLSIPPVLLLPFIFQCPGKIILTRFQTVTYTQWIKDKRFLLQSALIKPCYWSRLRSYRKQQLSHNIYNFLYLSKNQSCWGQNPSESSSKAKLCGTGS